MKLYKIALFIFFILEFSSTTKTFANSNYIYSNENNRCLLETHDKTILLAGNDERTYFYFQCVKIQSTYEINYDKKYIVSELLLSTSPKSNNTFIRIIERKDNTFTDNGKLSYLLSSCIPPKKDNNKFLVNYLINNKKTLEKICNIDDATILIGDKTYLYDKVGNNFIVRKSYLVKNDKIFITDYFVSNGQLWFFINYNGKVKKWIPAKSIF